jgi:serine/threonine protein kinase
MSGAAALSNVRSDYACDARRLGHGGYAEVFAATHKPTGRRVAFKRLHPSQKWSRKDSVPRMRREIEVMREMATHPHVMPVLDGMGRRLRRP